MSSRRIAAAARIALAALVGFGLGARSARADSVDDSTTVALTTLGPGGLLAIGCIAFAALTDNEEKAEDAFDRKGFALGASGSYARQDFDNSPNFVPFATSLSGVDDDALGFSVRGGYRCNSYLSADYQFEWLDAFEGTVPGRAAGTLDDARFEPLVFTSNLKLHILTGRIQPFVLIGPGFMRMESKYHQRSPALGTPLPNQTDRVAKFAARFGGGVEFYATPSLVLGVDASYVMPTGKLDGFDYISVGWGLQYRF
ncbi:MAG TPA: outer membrane beta-barrel protein [Myxococcota bacterium]|nr:outer membrane beta-barrel protein [Myxococcota bacterium]